MTETCLTNTHTKQIKHKEKKDIHTRHATHNNRSRMTLKGVTHILKYIYIYIIYIRLS